MDKGTPTEFAAKSFPWRRPRSSVKMKNALTSIRPFSLPSGTCVLTRQQLPDIFAQEKVWTFMMGVDGRANTALCAATRASIAKMFCPPPSSKAEGEGESSGASSATKPPSGLLHQDLLPEMMRLKKYVER